MTSGPINLHGTAVVLGKKGILITGPSGSGKSSLAFTLIAETVRQGSFAALVADDQILVSGNQQGIVARRPPSIAGLIEIRGSGIVKVPSVEEAQLHLAVRVISLAGSERLPPDQEYLDLPPFGALPLVRIADGCRTPLALLSALRPEFCHEQPFRGLLSLDF
ncbi:HPr kinase/phosphorylase [Rhizobium helianthi]|uniref:HPr kinase/phosphorylase n=1 Tax=Rhizobium helianthi TaxID=1132695 RepID=A0ABW4M711_9HYPH